MHSVYRYQHISIVCIGSYVYVYNVVPVSKCYASWCNLYKLLLTTQLYVLSVSVMQAGVICTSFC